MDDQQYEVHSQLVLAWLNLDHWRLKRRFIEQQIELLDSITDEILEKLYTTYEGQPEGAFIREHYVLLQEIRERGGTIAAIQAAFVNKGGGFLLDIPPWLEEAEQRDDTLRDQGPLNETARERFALWQHMTERIRSIPDISPEILAECNGLIFASANDITDSDPVVKGDICLTALAEAGHIYTQERYPRQWARVEHHIGDTYFQMRFGDRADHLQRAIVAYQHAIVGYRSITTQFQWACACAGLANAYAEDLSNDRAHSIELSLRLFSDALTVFTPESYPTLCVRTLTNTASSLQQRLKGDRAANQWKAIACYLAALEVNDPSITISDRGTALMNLGNAYREWISGNPSENLAYALTYLQSALDCFPRDRFPLEWAMIQTTRGSVFNDKRLIGRRDNNQRDAITCYKASLEVFTPTNAPLEWSHAHNNLGNVYQDRLEGDHEDNLERAIEHYKQALRIRMREVYPIEWAKTHHGWANALRQRHRGGRIANLDAAVEHYNEALTEFDGDIYPNERRLTLLHLAETHMDREAWEDAWNAYEEAITIEDRLVTLAVGIQGQGDTIKNGRDATTCAAYALARMGRIKEAVKMVERGRARMLAEARTHDAAKPERIQDPQLRQRYVAARTALTEAQYQSMQPLPVRPEPHIAIPLAERQRHFVSLQRIEQYQAAKREFDATVAEIRAANDPPDFLDNSIQFTIIEAAARRCSAQHALVYLFSTQWGGMALRYDTLQAEAQFLLLPALTTDHTNLLIEHQLDPATRRVIGGYAHAQEGAGLTIIRAGWARDTFRECVTAMKEACDKHGKMGTLLEAAREVLARPDFANVVDTLFLTMPENDLRKLSDVIDDGYLRRELRRCLPELGHIALRQVADWLITDAIENVTLIPCGALAAFPLTAVPLNDATDPQDWQTFGDVATTSMAPSARALLDDKSDDMSPRKGLFALGDPQPCGNAAHLVWGEAEALTLATIAKPHSHAVTQHTATRKWLLKASKQAEVLALSCHGEFDTEDFLQSSLLLAHGERVTLADTLNRVVDLRGLRLLILSACQTAILDLRGAKEEVHSLAAGMVQAGAHAVIGSLWSVYDYASYLLIVRFAQEWLPQRNHMPPATALANAQRWLRTVTNRELQTWLQSMPMPTQQQWVRRKGSTRQGRSTRYTAAKAAREVRQMAAAADDAIQLFADPIYWAAFIQYGW